jgi:hypothetical protein
MNSHPRASILFLLTALCVLGCPVTGAHAQPAAAAAPAVPDFDEMPGMARILGEGIAVDTTTVFELGYAKVSEAEYNQRFAAPKGVANVDSTTMLVAVNVLLIMQTGEVPKGGSESVITIDGDRFTISGTPSPAAGPSVWIVGDNGMVSQAGAPGDVPGALTKIKYRSADLDYDLYFYYGTGKVFLERIMRKSAADGRRTWTVAVEQDGVHYLKSMAADAKAAEAVETGQIQK